MTPEIWLDLEILRRQALGEPEVKVEKDLAVV